VSLGPLGSDRAKAGSSLKGVEDEANGSCVGFNPMRVNLVRKTTSNRGGPA
jgi:hypothetical protein